MIAVRTEEEIAVLRRANEIVADVLASLADRLAPGVTTGELDAYAEEQIRAAGARPSFLGYRGYPASVCVSVEEEVVHGIPGKRKLREGQIVSLDVGTELDGYYGDAALTLAVGQADALRRKLMKATDRALAAGVAAARAGNRLEAVSRAVQRVAENAGFSVVRNFVGHGIGTRMHEDPQIPNFVTGEPGPVLKAGMVLAIEPMVNAGNHEVRILKDGWTAVTMDRKPSAHFEHSIVVREEGGEILSRTPRLSWGVVAED